MNRNITLFIGILFGLLILPSFHSFSQTYPMATVDPWTIKSNQKSTYYPMLEWDTSPYKEFTYWKRSGPNSWEITDYLNFRMLFPKGYDDNDEKKYPIILFLHGAGESGIKWSDHFDYIYGYRDTPPEPEKVDNNDHQLRYGGREFLEARNKEATDPGAFPGFVVFPQVQYNGAWASQYDAPIAQNNKMVIELIEILVDKYKIDKNRIYLIGLSNGARGVWDLINRRPDLFAAAIPLSGVGDAELMADNLAHLPIWLFQGGEDDNPSPPAALQMISGLEDAGGTPRFTLYEDLGHGVWNRAFSEPDFFSWLTSKSKLSVHVYFGKTDFSPDEPIQVKMGISPGFSAYQWRKNGNIILNADKATYIAESPGQYQVRFSRDGEWTSWSEPVTISNGKDIKEMPVVYRINTGAASLQDEPIPWETDTEKDPSSYLSAPSVHTSTTFKTDIFSGNNATLAPNELFESYRVGTPEAPLIYSFPAMGEVVVKLFFAALPEKEAQEKSKTVFNIIIEGENVIKNFDLYEEAGENAYVASFYANVTDGNLNLMLEGVTGVPLISGIALEGNFDKEEVVTGIVPTAEAPAVTVYPNPFIETINVKLPKTLVKVDYLTIRNILGKTMYKQEQVSSNHLISINTIKNSLAPGLYFLEIKFDNNTHQTFKVLKQ